MKVFKDILEAAKIKSVSITFNEENLFCVPLEITGNQWTIAIDNETKVEGSCILNVLYKESFIQYNGFIKAIASEDYALYSCVHVLTLGNPLQEQENDIQFLNELRNIEKQQYQWNKRKEERFEIKSNIAPLNLDNPEQKIISIEKESPCYINNLSCSGAQIVTYNSYFQPGKPVLLLLSFVNPIEQIPIKAFIRHYAEKQTKNKQITLAILSLEFEHAPFSYQTRLEKFINSRNKS